MLRTYQQDFIKKHKGCGGIVRYIESLDPTFMFWFDVGTTLLSWDGVINE